MIIEERYKGQLDLLDPELCKKPIFVIGCGGIGSWTTLLLAKTGFHNITVFDDDIVEEHNVASQFFKESDLGKLKRVALRDNVLEQTGITVLTKENMFERNIDEGIVIIAVDSMEIRIELEELFHDKNVYIIDGRMGGLQLEIYCDEANRYKETLCDPGEVEHDLCTAKAISFNCAVIGGFITNYVRLYIQGRMKREQIIYGFESATLIKLVAE